MSKFNLLVISITLPATLMYADVASAAATAVPTVGAAATSFVAAAAIVGTGGAVVVKRTDFWGTVLGGVAIVGGVAIGIVDPPPAIFFDGSFTFHYDSSLMRITNSGWLGSWGENPTLLAPPVNPDLWDGSTGEGTTVVLQQPNPNLSASIVDDLQNGLQTISFDWGATGQPADSTDPFNFFATTFEFTKNAEIIFLGDFAEPPSGANFFVSTEGLKCTIPTLPPPDDTIIRTCGESTTSYYRILPVPEPTSTLSLLALGTLGAGATLKRKLKSSKSTKNEPTKVG